MTDSIRRRYVFFLVNYFAQGAIAIIYEPLDYVLKDRLKLTAGEAASFFGWMTLPLLFKPLYGLVTDLMPIGSNRRKPHLLLASIMATAAFLWLALQTSYHYLSLLLPLTLGCFAMAFADVVCGGLLVSDGKERDQVGPYQAIHIGALYLSIVLSGLGGGWMVSHFSYRTIFGLGGVFPFAIFVAALMIHETAAATPKKSIAVGAFKFIQTKRFWALGISIFLWSFYPFLGTVQFYYQSNTLGIGPLWIGSLMTMGSIAGLAGSAAFWKYSIGRDKNSLILSAPLIMSAVSLTYLFYLGPVSTAIVEVLFGFASVFFRLVLLDLIARLCPTDAEATFYAGFLAFFDLGMYSSNVVGGKLYDFLQRILAGQAHHDQLAAGVLILIGSACTLACRWILPIAEPPPVSFPIA